MQEFEVEFKDAKKLEWLSKFKEFLRTEPYPYNNLVKAAQEDKACIIDFSFLQKWKWGPELSELLLQEPALTFGLIEQAMEQTDLPEPVKVRFSSLPDLTNIRDLRSRHIGKFVYIEGIVRRASEIRPEVMEMIWECPECEQHIVEERKGNTIYRPFQCECGNRRGFKKLSQKLVDTRWITIEEPFELTEGERPSQVTVLLTHDLVSTDGRRISEPGNKLIINGVLKDIPKGQLNTVKLDFYLDANYIKPTEIGWERVQVSREDEEEIKQLAADPEIYEKLIASLAPSIYGLDTEKESIILQLFGGVPRTLKDGTKLRGEIHILMIGDPASGKSQLLKLVPEIVPRGKYVSGKGTTTAGLTATVTKDEQFMGGWVLEAGAIVLANKGLLSIDEFEKMTPEDQVAMHEALEQGCYDGSTEIIFEDGSKTQIGDFVERLVAGEIGDKISKDISDKNVYLLSSDFRQIKPSKVIAVGKHKEGSIYRIVLSTGQEIKITPNHPVFIIRNGFITPIEAKKLRTGDYIPVPKRLSLHGSPQPLQPQRVPQDRKHKWITFPTKTSNELCEWLGLIIGEGNAEVNRGIRNGVCFSNGDTEILERYKYIVQKLFAAAPYVQVRKKDSLQMVRLISRPLYDFVCSLGPDILAEPWKKSLPEWVNKVSNGEISCLLRGLFDAEGSVNYNYGTITFSTTSHVLARQVRELLLRFEVFSGIYEDRSMKGKRQRIAYKVQISGKGNISNFAKFIGFAGSRSYRLEKLLRKQTVSSLWNHIPNAMSLAEEIRKSLRLSYDEIAGHELTLARKRNNITKDMLRRIIENFESRMNLVEAAARKLKNPAGYEEFRELRESLGISRSEIARELGMSEQNLWYWKVIKKDKELFEKSVEAARKILSGMMSQKEAIEKLIFITEAPVEWVRIKSISHQKGSQWVYDVAMNPTGIFIGNGVICHNSVSIAKASIVATLPAQTSVLAGGNPKFSRFDPYIAISKQITISPTLLSRFDLKFALMDKPDPASDKRVVEHILKAREEGSDTAKPAIPREMIRKYIAYAKDRYKPEMTEEVGKMLKNFYVRSRRKASAEGGAIPLSLRQFEALIRLSEASARIQLAPKVRVEDGQRAIKLMNYSLKQLGYDPETRQIDIDRAEGGTSSSERNKIRAVLEIINELSKKKKEIPISEIEEMAKKDNIENPDEIIDKLKREGMLFEPTPGYVQKV